MGDLTESSTPHPTPPSRQPPPFREDCWTEEATATLVDAWGRRYLELNRGNLRQKDWQDVADAVNARHGLTKKTHRTDVQCKNRVDTLKKKYKIEKARVSDSNATVSSSWPFFSRLDFLIGSNFNKNHQSKVTPVSKSSPSPQSTPNLSPPMAVPLAYRRPVASGVFTPMILPQKRPMPVDESYFRRNYSAMAAAAAAAEGEDDADEEDGETEGEDAESSEGGRAVGEEEEEGEGGMRRLAKAIEKFGEIYEKVESMKQRQTIELEKQRMQFAKDLEVQRMRLFMDTQVQLERIKHAKRSGSSDDVYS